jgi:tetratricopeptide (TPR) repeat protein
MNYQEYSQRVHDAADLVDRGECEDAIQILQEVLALDISAMDKAIMCLNIAIAFDKLGRTDDALAWYEKGADYENEAGTWHVSEHRAAYLAEKERWHESVLSYHNLLSHPGLGEGDKQRIRHNIKTLLHRAT